MAHKLFDLGHKLFNSDISYLIFNVTNRCNAYCDHCFNWKKVSAAGVSQQEGVPSKREELAIDEIQKITENLSPMLLVNLCGGEPFLREELVDIVSLFKMNTDVSYITIPSNGFLTETIVKNVEQMCKKHPDIFFRLSISIDGFGKEHDRIRKHPGGFDKALQTATELNRLKKHISNFSLSVATVFSQQTQDSLEDLIDFLHGLHLFDILSVLCIRGNPRDFQLMNIDMTKYKNINNKIMGLTKFDRHPANFILQAMHEETIKTVIKAKKIDHRVFKCFAGQKMAVIDDIGTVFACEILEEQSLGNLRDFDYNLAKLLQNDQAQQVIKFIKQKKCACSWECAISTSWLFNLYTIPQIAYQGLLKLGSLQ